MLKIHLLQAQSEDEHEDDLGAADSAQGQFMEEFFEQVTMQHSIFIKSDFCCRREHVPYSTQYK